MRGIEPGSILGCTDVRTRSTAARLRSRSDEIVDAHARRVFIHDLAELAERVLLSAREGSGQREKPTDASDDVRYLQNLK